MNVLVDVQQASNEETIPAATFVESWVVRAVCAAGQSAQTEVSVRIVDRDEMQTLNRDYRDKDKPTNVLSFPAGEVAGLPDDEPLPLGDIVICAGVVHDEAVAQGKAVMDHWAHMLVHGTLHLLGYDHKTDAQAAEMEALETRILNEHGVTDPYGAAVQTC